jgi:two-component system, chemotaxis family, chemotaxis protein CheY
VLRRMSLKLKNLHVLIIEDIQPMRELTSAILKSQGIGTISYAADGEKGYDAYCKLRPDIILTDWQMPHMDGLELTKLIRTSQQSPDKTIPIVMMTGYGSPQKISAARDFGVTEFLVKPFSAIDISKRIQNVIRSPRDFIVTSNYAGPDRRRKVDTGTSPAGTNNRTNPEGYKERIKSNHLLQSKVGMGIVPEDKIVKSQSILEKNEINFVPIATNFLKQLRVGLDDAYKDANPNRKTIEKLIDPVMQIKANARIFKYGRLGDLASIMLNFLEGMNELDNDVLEIVEAHHKTLSHIIQERLQGDGGNVGQTFENELDAVCRRYVQSRIMRQKEALLKVISTE